MRVVWVGHTQPCIKLMRAQIGWSVDGLVRGWAGGPPGDVELKRAFICLYRHFFEFFCA